MGYIGYRLGLSAELPKLGALIVSFFLSFRYYQLVGDRVAALTFLRVEWACALAMVMLASAVYLAATFGFRFLGKLAQMTFHPQLTQAGGLLAGLLRGALVASVVLVVCQQLPSEVLKQSIEAKSFSGGVLIRAAPAVYDTVSLMLRRVAVGIRG